MESPYEKYGDDEKLLEELTQVFLSNNPHMSLGDRMSDPVILAENGKDVTYGQGGKAVAAQSAKFMNESVEDVKFYISFYIYDDMKYLHPYRCMKQTIGANKYIIYRFGVSK